MNDEDRGDWPAPTFDPITLRCQCGHQWRDWLPAHCCADLLIAAMRLMHCPKCGEKSLVYLMRMPDE